MKHVVKRKGHTEPFEDRKVYAAVYASSLNCHHDEKTAEKMASKVTKHMKEWIKDRKEIKSHELRKEIKNQLDNIDPDVGFMYETIMDVC